MADTDKDTNGSQGAADRTVNWDDSKMQTDYATVCNVASTREEVTLLFGTNQTWHAGQTNLTVQLSHRIVLNPYAAKRLSMLLSAAIEKYEATFGKIVIQAESAPG